MSVPFTVIRSSSFSLLALIAVIGCSGSDDGPRTVPVSGVVTYNGAPVTNATLTFAPLETTKANATQASTDAEGQFATSPGKGLVAGKYKVVVQAFKVPLHEIPPKDLPTKGGDANLAVPKKYTDVATTDLEIVVAESDRSKNLALELKD